MEISSFKVINTFSFKNKMSIVLAETEEGEHVVFIGIEEGKGAKEKIESVIKNGVVLNHITISRICKFCDKTKPGD